MVNFIKPPVPSISFDANKTCKIIDIQLLTNKDTIESKCYSRRVIVWIFGSHKRYCFAKAHESKGFFSCRLSNFSHAEWQATVSFPFIYSHHLTILGSWYCKNQIDVSFLSICPLIVITMSKFTAEPLWQCYDTDRQADRHRQNSILRGTPLS